MDNYFSLIKKTNQYRFNTAKDKEPYICYYYQGYEDYGCTFTTDTDYSASEFISINEIPDIKEGNITKHYKNFLIILRGNKLYSVNIGLQQEKTMVVTNVVKAHKSDWNHKTWFDEMLIDDGMIIVLGYNYDLNVSEVTRFDLSDSGMMTYRDSYLITSDDYRDEVNYATRLINHHYTAYVNAKLNINKPFNEQIPSMARIPDDFRGDKNQLDWQPVLQLSDIYFPIQSVLEPMLHSFIRCPLSEQEFSCQSVGFISSLQKTFYINGDHIYLWASAWKPQILLDGDFKTYYAYYDYLVELAHFNKPISKDIENLNHSMVYRVSLTNFNVDAVQIKGIPNSTFSFHHNNNILYVYTSIDNHEAELVKIPDELFNSDANQHPLIVKSFADSPFLSANHRFIGDYFLIGSERDKASNTYQLNVINMISGQTTTLSLSHAVNRIESIHDMAFIAGDNADLNLGISLLSLKKPQNITSHFLFDRLESEEINHTFNFHSFDEMLLIAFGTQNKLHADCDDVSCFWDFQEPSDVTFMGFNGLIDYVGELNNQHTPYEDCGDACDDWYGNTRPFFIGKRIFVLSGDELIEAYLDDDNQIIETNRVVFTDYP